MPKKTFKGNLVINWKNGAMRVTKRKVKGLAPFEIPVKIELTLITPDEPDIRVKGTIVIPETKATEIFVECLDDGGTED